MPDVFGPAQAIILAAGRGTRLGAHGNDLPKTLLRFGDESILERQLGLCRRVFGDVDVTIVVGHEADAVRAVGGPGVRYVENGDYGRTNTAVSLAMAFAHDGRDALVLNGDVMLDEAAMRAIATCPAGALSEFKPSVDPEEVQVHLDHRGVIDRIGKGFAGAAEAVGVYRFTSEQIAAYLAEYDRDADADVYYEDVFSRLVPDRVVLSAVPLGPGDVIEIDTPADLAVARSMFDGHHLGVESG